MRSNEIPRRSSEQFVIPLCTCRIISRNEAPLLRRILLTETVYEIPQIELKHHPRTRGTRSKTSARTSLEREF